MALSRETPYPLGGELPPVYYRTLDPFVTLAAAAALTSRIELFTEIAPLIECVPIITAKEAASIYLISGGRFVFAVGAGWNIEELRDHGTDQYTRGALLDERIEAIKALWTEDPAEYHGKYVDFDSLNSRPKPVRKLHPPIFIGGDSDASATKRVIRHKAGWISNPLPVEVLTTHPYQMRDGAGHDVPLAMFRTPQNPDYWRAAAANWVSAAGAAVAHATDRRVTAAARLLRRTGGSESRLARRRRSAALTRVESS